MIFFANNSGWLALGIAIVFGVLGTIFMKISHGLKRYKPAICVICFYAISFMALTLAMKQIQLSIVYAVWSGIGTVLVTTVGVFYFKESASLRKIFYLLLIIVGVIGIHLSEYFT